MGKGSPVDAITYNQRERHIQRGTRMHRGMYIISTTLPITPKLKGNNWACSQDNHDAAAASVNC